MDPEGCEGDNEEESLDVEWAHAMAPRAKIILVEAAPNYPALFAAVGKAGELNIRRSFAGWDPSAPPLNK